MSSRRVSSLNWHPSSAAGGYAARWVFSGDCEPIEHGTVEIADGRIVAISSRRDPGAVDLGRVAIVPGLINAHTHLEFSDLSGPLGPSGDFTGWIRAVLAHRRTRAAPATRRGVEECLREGTTCVGEIAAGDDWGGSFFSFPSSAWERAAPRAVVFRELIGRLPEQIDEQLAIARAHLAAPEAEADGRVAGAGRAPPDHPSGGARWSGSPGVRGAGARSALPRPPGRASVETVRGLSPHAPYSVHPQLFERLVELAAERKAPLGVHLAETREELQFLQDGSGGFSVLLRELDVWRDELAPRGVRPLDYLRLLERLDRGLVIHGNYLAQDELDFLASRPGIALVYCPRTHAYFGHPPHPWREVLERGGLLALGTDSRASNPDLSLWRELVFLKSRHPDFDTLRLLRLGTLNGARALGIDSVTGRLAPGSAADLAVVSLAGGDSADELFHPDNRIIATMCAGEWVWVSDRPG